MKVYCLMVSAFCVLINPTHSQFFYSHYTTPFAPVVPQAFPPAIPRIAAFPPIVPLPYNLQQGVKAASASTVRYVLSPVQNSEYLGFGYRTDFKDGASSTVFFVTGPESNNLRSFNDFPNFTRKVQESPEQKSRSLASDLTDLNAVPNPRSKIQSILQPSEFQKLFDNAMTGVINFYNFPASTVPLTRGSINSTNSESTSTTTESTGNEEAAESVVNPKIIKNEIGNTDKSTSTTTTTTTTTTSTSTTTATSISIEAVGNITTETSESLTEGTTLSSNESTTVETTTTQV